MSEMITIEVNGKQLSAKAGEMLIQVTDANGIEIPRFCYHKKLSIAANCRMCLVEVEKAPKALPACATPVMDGMKVWTRSPAALAAQQATMEFLLINHPLDCPICDQGGECELQDVSVAYGSDQSQYVEEKRITFDKNIGPLISTDLTRCIQCTRCVRFGDEIAGMRELGMVGRGDRESIATFAGQCITSELSGNVVDVCPVGALTMKPSRYKARAWEVIQTASIAPHDSVGSNVYHHTFEHKVMRTVPQENDAVNECWLSDRDRFSYEGLYSDERLEHPMLKKNGEWHTVSWDEALDATAKVLNACDKDSAAVLASPNATLEELYLLQKSMRAIGINSIDHRLRQSDFSGQDSAPLSPQLGISLEDLETQQAVLLVGSTIRYEQPMANHRLRKASLQGASVMTVNPYEIEFNYHTTEQCVSTAPEMLTNLAAIAKASGASLANFADVAISTQAQTIADNLNNADKAILLLGNLATQHPAYADLCALANTIAAQTGATLGYLPESANTAGAWLAGAVPHRKEAGQTVDNIGKSSQQILSSDTKTFVLLGVEAEFDCDNPQQSLAALSQADNVIAINSYANATLKSRATILLPASQTVETSGTFVNMEGRFQSFTGVSKLPAEARPTWKILRVLGNVLDVDGFDYMSSEEVRDEVKATVDAVTQYSHTPFSEPKPQPQQKSQGLQRIGAVQMYSGDSLVRRAAALQRAAGDERRNVSMHPNDIATLSLQADATVSVSQGDSSVRMHLIADTAIPIGSALIPAATQKSTELGAAFGIVQITKG
jgi:NADH-quinone oxidoreductase subunit G